MRNFEKSGSEIKKKMFPNIFAIDQILRTPFNKSPRMPKRTIFFFLNECYSDFKMKEKKKKKKLFHGVRTYKAGH